MTTKTETLPPITPTTLDECTGAPVLIRDHMAGVYCGILRSIDLAAGTWELRECRQIHYWARAAATMGLATYGKPGQGSRVCPVRPLVAGRALVAIAPMEADAYKAILACEEWRP